MKMKIGNYKIPPECSHMSVDAYDDKLVITFEPENYGDFHCELTGRVESVPSIGDLAVLWDDKNRRAAIIAHLVDDNTNTGDVSPYQAANEQWFNHAARFRSEEQYKLISGRL